MQYLGWFSSGGFVLLTIPISLRLILMHLTHWYAPHIQKYVVRIIWMIPIYSVESWLALRFKYMALYFEKLRECYEAYAIFCFLYYLIAILGGDETTVALKLKSKSEELRKYPFVSKLLNMNFWSSSSTSFYGMDLLQKLKFGVFQYVLIKNSVAIMVYIMHINGIYHEEGDFLFDPHSYYLYICIISNISQLYALYCMILFYLVTKDELQHCHPVGKFLCVKSVVFFTWWQSLCIEIFFSLPIGKY